MEQLSGVLLDLLSWVGLIGLSGAARQVISKLKGEFWKKKAEVKAKRGFGVAEFVLKLEVLKVELGNRDNGEVKQVLSTVRWRSQCGGGRRGGC
jgi:hypothetical protein